jgi:hypothetical protein
MPPKKKDKKKVVKKTGGNRPQRDKKKEGRGNVVSSNTNKINNKVVVNVNTQSKRKPSTRKPSAPKQSLYDQLEAQRGQLRQQQTYQPPPIIYMQPLQEGSKNPRGSRKGPIESENKENKPRRSQALQEAQKRYY